MHENKVHLTYHCEEGSTSVLEIIEQLRKDIAAALGVQVSEVDPQADLLDQGLDSVRMMGLVDRLAAAGHSVDFADLAEDPRLVAWDQLLRS